mmetsp:Transcript_22205/g.40009  ORF Transcript_22205/g.40009 Transcript_22205/m.40009 type:complete len:311 (-) Transcript_22205:366-1298(-)
MSEPDAASTSTGDDATLRRQLSSQLSRLIVGEEEAPERQPLTAQVSTTGNRLRFEQNRRIAARTLVFGTNCFFLLVSLLAIAWVVTAMYFYIKGWLVYLEHGQGKCDQPLSTWLLLALLCPAVSSSLQRRHAEERPNCMSVVSWFLSIMLIVLGGIWLGRSQTCQETDSELYNFVKAYIIFLGVTWTFLLSVPIAALIVIILGMQFGWFEAHNGADPKTIAMLEKISYDADLFSRPGEVEDGKYPSECCICCENFGPELTIKRTPCKHCFHEECLSNWLKVTTTCPLCRNDLEQAVLHPDLEAGRDQQAS